MRSVQLDGAGRRRLRLALLDAFPSWQDLRIMVSDQLDGENLASITAAANNLETAAFELIEWAQARGRDGQLVTGARNANPDNPRLFALAAALGLTAGPPADPALEKIVSRNGTFLDVGLWRAELTRMEWRVCRVDCGGTGVGTGFLVGPDAVLTNHHVVDDAISGAKPASSWTCRFDWKLTTTGAEADPGVSVPFAGDDRWLIDAAPPSAVDWQPDPKSGDPGLDELDFALVRLAQRVGESAPRDAEQGEQRGWIAVRPIPARFDNVNVIAILQHPQTEPLKLALGGDEQPTLWGGDRRVRYGVPTLPGSSGSPVFDGDWNLVALHHAGDPQSLQPAYNEGIPIGLIASREAVAGYLEEVAG